MKSSIAVYNKYFYSLEQIFRSISTSKEVDYNNNNNNNHRLHSSVRSGNLSITLKC